MTSRETQSESDAAAQQELEPLSMGRALSMILGVMVFVFFLGGWLWVTFLYEPHVIDKLEDTTFPSQAEEICAAARGDYDKLPLAQESPTPAHRSTVIVESNQIFNTMVDDLREIVPASPEHINEGLNEWLDDWETYIGDRQQLADSLLENDSARFMETPKSNTNKGITRAINGFAEVNEMESCETPGDLS